MNNFCSESVGVFFTVFLIGMIGLSFAATDPELPRVFVNTSISASGSTINVPAGGNFQAAIDSANPGDTIVLQAGASYRGQFTLKNKTGSQYITVQSSELAKLPKEGERVRPSDAVNMPKILVTVNGESAIKTAADAHHYRFVGIEFAKASPNLTTYELISLGSGTQTGSVPRYIIFDRVYVHGDASGYLKRCVGLNSAHSAVIDSYISDCHAAGQDSQAIAGFSGPGPFKIVNNYLEGAGENVIFGGSDPKIAGLIPSDIEFRMNHVAKNVSWRGKGWSIKNLFELKNAKRVLIDGNIFEYNWLDAQTGIAIVIKSTNQDGKCSWCEAADVTFTNNIVRHAGGAVSLLGNDYLFPNSTGRTQRIKIENNLFDDINGSAWGGSGWLFYIGGGTYEPGPEDVQIIHNTAFQTGTMLLPDPRDDKGNISLKHNFVFRDNIAPHNAYGVFASGMGFGGHVIDAFFPGGVFKNNVIMGGPAKSYANYSNYFPKNWTAVGFADMKNKNYTLSASSQYRKNATDGKDIGADMNKLMLAIAGVSTSVSNQTQNSTGNSTGFIGNNTSGNTTGNFTGNSTGMGNNTGNFTGNNSGDGNQTNMPGNFTGNATDNNQTTGNFTGNGNFTDNTNSTGNSTFKNETAPPAQEPVIDNPPSSSSSSSSSSSGSSSSGGGIISPNNPAIIRNSSSLSNSTNKTNNISNQQFELKGPADNLIETANRSLLLSNQTGKLNKQDSLMMVGIFLAILAAILLVFFTGRRA